jgi:hypothetical protein
VPPVADTPVADQLKASIARYIGAHSIVFGTAHVQRDHARLLREGFAPLEPIALQRDIATEQGMDVARFNVVRVPPGAMPEGRMQFCQHLTPALVWQARWLAHPNAATALLGVTVCVADLDEAKRRYERFTGVRALTITATRVRIELYRGWVEICDAGALRACWGINAPAIPWVAGCTLQSADLAAVRRCVEQHELSVLRQTPDHLSVAGPRDLGGVFTFVAA